MHLSSNDKIDFTRGFSSFFYNWRIWYTWPFLILVVVIIFILVESEAGMGHDGSLEFFVTIFERKFKHFIQVFEHHVNDDLL